MCGGDRVRLLGRRSFVGPLMLYRQKCLRIKDKKVKKEKQTGAKNVVQRIKNPKQRTSRSFMSFPRDDIRRNGIYYQLIR